MMNKFDGPIPGENYTSDTKNYPWHRPPEFNDLDLAIDHIGKKLTKEESAVGMLAMLDAGLSIVDLTQMFLMSGVANGKWTLDFALILAGPTAHIMMIIAKAYGLKYNLGIDGKAIPPPSKAFFEATQEINRAKAAAAGRSATDQIDDIQADTSNTFKQGSLVSRTPMTKFKGFGSAENPKEESQDTMLGRTETTEPTGEV